MDVTLTGLLADVRRQGSIPNVAATGSQDSDLMSYLNDAMMGIAAEVIKCREGFYRRYKDHTLSSSQTRYRIPTRAVGNRLASVLLLDSAGKTLRKLDEVAYSRAPELSSVTDTTGYYLEAGDVVLTPSTTSSATTLRMVYYLRPSDLSSSLDTASGDCFTVTAVSGNVITLMASHGLTTGTKIDIIKAGPPHEALTVDELPSATTSTTITVADGSRVEIGDFVCKADKSPVPQVPDAFRPILPLMAAQSYWLALREQNSVALLGKAIEDATKQAVALIAPRVEDGAKKIMSTKGALGSLRGYLRRGY